MILLDTDTITLLSHKNPRVLGRLQAAEKDTGTTIITWIEVLRGRFDAIFKAADANELRLATQRLRESREQLASFTITPLDSRSADEFGKLLHNKKFRKFGRGDLLIASIVLANKATLVTRNVRDFQQIPGLRIENWAD